MKRGSPALIFNLHHLLYGEELIDLTKVHVVVENGVIKEVSSGWVNEAITNGGVAIPLPVNAHVHLNDYRAPDHHYGLSLPDYAGRKGVKHALITLFKDPIMPIELASVLTQYSVVVDYQEDFNECSLLKFVLTNYGVNYIGLSRPLDWFNDDLFEICRRCNGLGISNPTVVPPHRLNELSNISREYIVSAHVSESQWMETTGGLHYLLSSGVRLKHVVHGVFLEDWEFKLLADNDIALITCPRSNLWFTNRLPNINAALNHGVKVAIGTDNAGCFHPDVWMDAYTLLYYLKLDPKLILEMLLINGYRAIGWEPKVIKEGVEASFMVLDLGLANERSGNIYLSIINRAEWCREKIVVKKGSIYKT